MESVQSQDIAATQQPAAAPELVTTGGEANMKEAAAAPSTPSALPATVAAGELDEAAVVTKDGPGMPATTAPLHVAVPMEITPAAEVEPVVQVVDQASPESEPASRAASPSQTRASASPPRSSSSSNSCRGSRGQRSRSSSARSADPRPQGRQSETRVSARDRTPGRWPNRRSRADSYGGKGGGRSKGGKGTAGRHRDSRSPPRNRARSRSAARGGGKGNNKNFNEGKRFRTECWFGENCTRLDCWFAHPKGRLVDVLNGKRARSPSNSKSRSKSRCHSKGRIGKAVSRSPSSSSSSSRPRRPRHGGRASPPPRRRRAPRRSVVTPKGKARSPSYKRPVASPDSSRVSSPCPPDGNDQAPCPATPPPSASASFRSFVWTELDDAITPDQAVAKFKEHNQRLAEKDLEKLKGSGLLFDVYNPLALARRFDLRICTAQRNAQTFLQDLNMGRYKSLSLRTAATATRNGVCPTAGHMVAPHFAFDPDADVLWLSGIPPAVSVWDIHDNLQSQPGFVAISMPLPQNGLLRDVRVRFASPGHARAALNALANAQLKEGYKMRPALVDTAPTLDALVAPPEMSNPQRILKDVDLCTRVLRKLDSTVSVPAEVTTAFLNKLTDETAEARLDMQLMYLRRVHHFCFYGCAWCDDEWELRRRCGAALLRTSTEAAAAPPEGAWSEAHQRRIEAFLKDATLERPFIMTMDEEPLKKRATEQCAAKTLQVTPAKFQCTLCRKFFKGPEYVHKHIRKVHTELFEAVRLQVLQEAACAAYLADSNRPRGDAQSRKVVS